MIKILGLIFLMLLSSCNHNVSNFKELVIKDGDTIVDKAYYNTVDNTWYEKADTKSAKITELNVGEKNYKAYFKNENTPVGEISVPITLLGYGKDGSVAISYKENTVSLNGVKITDNTEYAPIYDKGEIYKIDVDNLISSKVPIKEGYTLKGWKKEGNDDTVLFKFSENYKKGDTISGDTTFVAVWEQTSIFYLLTVEDGGKEIDRAYFNRTDKKWYVKPNFEDGEKREVAVPTNKNKIYTIVLNYDNGNDNQTREESSEFIGYGIGDEIKIEEKGSDGILLKNYEINDTTKLGSVWSKIKLSVPEEPTKDGYTFVSWYNGDVEYNFENEITSDITLTAHWEQKTYYELLVFPKHNDGTNANGLHIYYGSDGCWYSDAEYDNKVGSSLLKDIYRLEGENIKIDLLKNNIPLLFYKNIPQDANVNDFKIVPEDAIQKDYGTYIHTTDYEIPVEIIKDNEYIDENGKIKVTSIDKNITLRDVAKTVLVPINKNFSMTSNNPKYTFGGWYDKKNPDVIISNIAEYKIDHMTEFYAKWNEVSVDNPEHTQTVNSVKRLDIHSNNDSNLTTVYYNTENKKWYSDENTTNEITNVMVFENPSQHSSASLDLTVRIDDKSEYPVDSQQFSLILSGFGVGGKGRLKIGGEVKAKYSEDSQKNLYCNLADCSITENAHWYEIWQHNSILNDGKVKRPQYTPEKEGYNFIGWYKTNENTPYDFDTIVDSSFTIEARFEPIATT